GDGVIAKERPGQGKRDVAVIVEAHAEGEGAELRGFAYAGFSAGPFAHIPCDDETDGNRNHPHQRRPDQISGLAQYLAAECYIKDERREENLDDDGEEALIGFSCEPIEPARPSSDTGDRKDRQDGVEHDLPLTHEEGEG